jgi:hypothetical protein
MDKILCIIWEQTTLNISYVLQVNRDPMLSLSYFRISRRSPKASTQWTETDLSNSLASSSCPRSTSTCEWLLTATLPLWIWKVYLCNKNRQQKLSRNSDASLHREVLTCSHYARKNSLHTRPQQEQEPWTKAKAGDDGWVVLCHPLH